MVSIITSLNISVQNIFTKTIEKQARRKTILSIFAIAVFLLSGNLGFSQTPPSISCPASITTITLPPGDGGLVLDEATILAVLGVTVAEPDGDLLTYTAVPPIIECTDIGVGVNLSIFVTVSDVDGSDNCTINIVNILDGGPFADCMNFTAYLGSSPGMVTVMPSDIDDATTPSSACTGISLYEISKDGIVYPPPMEITYDCTETGANIAFLRVTDGNGAMATCTATVTVLDTISPVITCPADPAPVSNTAGMCEAPVTIALATETDNCTGTVITNDFNANGANASDTYPVGTTKVLFTATDASGNTDTCSIFVVVNDTELPTITCGVPFPRNNDPGDCSYQVMGTEFDPTAMDNCEVDTVYHDYNGGGTTLADTILPVGVHVITWTVVDTSGNMDDCMSTITITDNELPTVTCVMDQTRDTDTGLCTYMVIGTEFDTVSTTDNCGIASVTNDFNASASLAGALFSEGTTTVIWTVTDVNGNMNTCSFDVTIEDNEAPVISNCPPLSAVSDTIQAVTNTGVCETTVGWLNPTVADACNGIASFTTTALDPGGSPIIITVGSAPPTPPCTPISLFAGYYDVGSWTNSGNVNTAGAPASIAIVEGDNPTTFSIAAEYDGVISFDWSRNAGLGTFGYILGSTFFQVSAVGVFSGSVEVPVNSGQNFALVQNNGFGTVTATVSNFAFTCAAGAYGDFPVGVSSVTYEVMDNEGNADTCTFYVEVIDGEAPVAVCQNITVQLDATGNASILPTAVDGGSSDNCGIDTRTLSNSTFDCDSVGVRTVELYITDFEGNADTCTATVTVEDNVAPTAVCQNITVQLDGTGTVTITPAQVDNGSSDACGIMSLALDQTAFTCADVGNNLVTLTVTDVNGNVSTCNAQVTVQDLINPVAVCQNITVQLDAAGNVSITGADIDGGSTDNCGIASLVASPNTFNCANVGANTVTLTVTDDNGNVATCTSTVTVEDNVLPTVVCQDITVQLDGAGTVTIAPAALVNTSGDNCGIASTTASQTTFTCADIVLSPVSVTVTVTDVNGNMNTCTALVTVQDNVNPTITCPSNLTRNANANCLYVVSGTEFNPTFSDNCSATISNSINATATLDGEILPLGNTNVTWTATDPSGNSVTCNITIVVEDNTDPVITVPADFSQPVDLAQCDAVVTFATSATDNCDASVDIVCIPPSGSTFPVGPTTVTCTATDDAGNIAVDTFVVTIVENELPNAVCQNITVQLDASGMVSITAGQIDNGSTDNCGISTITVSPNTFDCSNIGANTVTLTVTDAAGNVNTCTATVTVQDNIAPTITCPGDIVVDADAGCDAAVTLALATASDNCIANITNDFNAGGADASGTYPLGTTIVTFTAADTSGNSVTCNMTVTVEDNTAPTITCPANITVSAGASCSTAVTVPLPTIVDTDGCGATATNNFNGTGNASGTYPLGTTSVIWTVSDPSGNANTCTMTVTVVDNAPPTWTGVGQMSGDTITVPASGGGCTAIVNWTAPTFTDNCLGVVVPTASDTPGSTFSVGTHTVVYTATDPSGNATIHSFTVIVTDGVAPVAGCQPVTINLFLVGSTVTLDALDVNLGSFDNCGIDSYLISRDGVNFFPSITFDCNDLISSPFTITLRVSDGVLTDDCTSTVTLSDNISPTAVCQNITVALNGSGNATITPAQINNGSSDNTSCLTLGLNITSFDCSDKGPNSVILTATDAGGNTDGCIATVTVVDNLAPVINIATVPNDTTIACSAAVPGNPGTITATDNCDTPVIVFSQTSTQSGNPNNCANYSYTITQTWTASDNSSNSSSESRVITVEDIVAPANPVIVDNIPANDIKSTDPNACTASVSLSVTAYTDCAPFANLTITNNSAFAVSGGANASGNYPIGFHAVQFTATDPCGNSSNWTVSFTVQDLVPPVASCINNLNLGLPASGILVLSPAAVNSGSFDNCGVISMMTVTPDTFTCADVGNTIPVTLRVWDDAGNSSTCNTSVTIQENNAPTAICQSITVYLDGNGQASITADDIDNNSFDDCTPVTISVTPSTFTDANLGNNTVTLTVTDEHGNSSNCNATVTVALPQTCFDVGIMSGGAGDIISVPVTAENFTALVGFQFELQLNNEDVGEFVGVSGVHPDLTNAYIEVLTNSDSTFVPIDTLDMQMPFDSIVFDTIVDFNGISFSWNQFNDDGMGNLLPITLADDEVLFNVDVYLTGNIGDFSIIALNGGSMTTIPQVVYSFGGGFIPNPACVFQGAVTIGELIIAGDIYNESGQAINLVTVGLYPEPSVPATPPLQTVVTMPDGAYEFILSAPGSYRVTPSKTINWSNGIDILDVSFIQRHSVGNPYVNSAYKKIAADVSGEGVITTFDAVLLNAYLASLFTATPPPTPSWQFVDAKQVLANNQNAFVPSFTDDILFPGINSDSLGNDFIAVKTGDLGGIVNADTLLLGGNPDDRNDDVLKFIIEDQALKAGDQVSIDLRAENFEQMAAYQWILAFDNEVLTYTGFDNVNLANLGGLGFGEVIINEGKLVLTWFNGEDVTKAKEEVLFSLNFEVKANANQLSDLLSVTTYDRFAAVAYKGLDTPMDIELVFAQPKAIPSVFALNQNTPNPFKDETVVSFTLPEATTATLTIMDITGRVLKQYKGTYAEGYNEISVNRSELSDSGVLFYELKTPDNSASRKMIIID